MTIAKLSKFNSLAGGPTRSKDDNAHIELDGVGQTIF
jgi:hypothetical protein